MCLNYAVTHEDFAWGVRGEPGVVGAFEKIYDDKDLIVSFDAINFTFPKSVLRLKTQTHMLIKSLAVQTLPPTSHGLIKTKIPQSLVSGACKVLSTFCPMVPMTAAS